MANADFDFFSCSQWEPVKPHEAANVKPRPVKRGRTCRAPAVSAEKLAQVIGLVSLSMLS